MRQSIPIIALLAGLTLATIAAREAVAEDGRGRDQVCVYEHIDYGGYEQCFPAGEDIADLGRFSNRISSVRIRGRAEIILFEQPNYRGRELALNSDVSDLRRFGFWNDKAESLRISAVGFRNRRDPQRSFGGGGFGGRGEDRVCFYEHSNFQGRSECWDSSDDVSDLRSSRWNDRISSVRTFGRTRVALYEHINFGGQRLVIERDVADLSQVFGDGRSSWNDRVSSFRVSGDRRD